MKGEQEKGHEHVEEQPAGFPKEIQDRIDLYRKSTFRQVWILGGVLFTVVTTLFVAALFIIPPDTIKTLQQHVTTAPNPINGQPASTIQAGGQTDFLKVFVPVIILAGGFVVGTLGLKRLEHFDTEIAQLRNDLTERGFAERRVTLQAQDSFRKQVDGRLKEVAGQVETQAQRFVSQAVEDQERKLNERQTGFREWVENIIKLVEERLDPHLWLADHKESLEHMEGIFTMGVAHERVSQFFREQKDDVALTVARYAVDNNLPGTADGFFNLATVLSKKGQQPLALQVAKNGLERYPKDVDLLACAINCSQGMGLMDDTRNFCKHLKGIPYSRWNWRAFVFSGDYLEADDGVEEAMELYELFRQNIPDDERAYSQPGKYYATLGHYQEAITVLEKGLKACRRAAQSAFTLSEIYADIGEYEKAIWACNRGLESNAEAQPSASQAAMLWQRSAARDALIHKIAQEKNETDEFWTVDEPILFLSRLCVKDYITAINMDDAIPPFRERGPQRIEILIALLKTHGASDDMVADVIGQVSNEKKVT